MLPYFDPDHLRLRDRARSWVEKTLPCENDHADVDQALQIHGGIGLVADTPVAQLYTDARALRIYEGTSEIQKLVIAKELLKKA